MRFESQREFFLHDFQKNFELRSDRKQSITKQSRILTPWTSIRFKYLDINLHWPLLLVVNIN